LISQKLDLVLDADEPQHHWLVQHAALVYRYLEVLDDPRQAKLSALEVRQSASDVAEMFAVKGIHPAVEGLPSGFTLDLGHDLVEDTTFFGLGNAPRKPFHGLVDSFNDHSSLFFELTLRHSTKFRF
jgi:hypothetical protein